jgi:ABC-type lipoprotein export system ATPase subunit
MGFELSQICPSHFETSPDSEIWNTNQDFQKGKSYLIHAASGKGKSTLFNILCGSSKAYSGSATFNGVDLKSTNHIQLSTFRKEYWSLIFQSLALFPHVSANENLNSEKAISENMASIEKLGIADILSKKTDTLSYGERQRLAIIRAISKPYQFLIMDEPFSHLDSINKSIAWEILSSDAGRKNAGIILLELENDPNLRIDQRLVL